MIFPVPSQRFCGACDVLWSFAAASADAGAVMAVAFNGAGVPLASVERGPFRSFLGPGIILGGCDSGHIWLLPSRWPDTLVGMARSLWRGDCGDRRCAWAAHAGPCLRARN
jgi:hypothetical protein